LPVGSNQLLETSKAEIYLDVLAVVVSGTLATVGFDSDELRKINPGVFIMTAFLCASVASIASVASKCSDKWLRCHFKNFHVARSPKLRCHFARFRFATCQSSVAGGTVQA
jgi:hypothetical protein